MPFTGKSKQDRNEKVLPNFVLRNNAKQTVPSQSAAEELAFE